MLNSGQSTIGEVGDFYFRFPSPFLSLALLKVSPLNTAKESVGALKAPQRGWNLVHSGIKV